MSSPYDAAPIQIVTAIRYVWKLFTSLGVAGALEFTAARVFACDSDTEDLIVKLFLIPGVGGPSFWREEVSEVNVAARGSILESWSEIRRSECDTNDLRPEAAFYT